LSSRRRRGLEIKTDFNSEDMMGDPEVSINMLTKNSSSAKMQTPDLQTPVKQSPNTNLSERMEKQNLKLSFAQENNQINEDEPSYKLNSQREQIIKLEQKLEGFD